MKCNQINVRPALLRQNRLFGKVPLFSLLLVALSSSNVAQGQSDVTLRIRSDVTDPVPQVDEREDLELRYGVELHTSRGPVILPKVAAANYCACMAIARTRVGNKPKDVAIIAIGGPPMDNKSRFPLKNIGTDPEECVLVVDLNTSEFQRIKYHHRRPDQIVISPDGQFVGMASSEGWIPPNESSSRYGSGKRQDVRTAGVTKADAVTQSDSIARKEKVDQGMHSLCVGTMKVSVWETTPFRPVWELRYSKRQANRAQHFSRPWSSYARVELPWWEENMTQRPFERVRIGFSSCSQYFVSLDEGQNVTVLRISDGKTFHCCPATKEVQPAAFFFDAEPGVVSVICTDHRIRQFVLESGEEVTDSHVALPWSARFLRDANGLLGMEFVANSSTGAIATIMPYKTLRILRTVSDRDRWKNVVDVTGVTETSIRRIDCSSDPRWIGVGYVPGYGDCRFAQHSEVYELIDLESSKVVKRIVSGVLVRARRSSKAGHEYGSDIDIITPDNFASCLSPDGIDIFYAFAVPGGN